LSGIEERLINTNLPVAAALILGRSLPRFMRPPSATLYSWTDRWFDSVTERRFPEGANLFYGQEGSCKKTLARARREGATTMLEGTLHPTAYDEILGPEYDRLGLEFSTKPRADVLEETAAADLVITQSEFGQSTYRAAGIPTAKIVTLPLGIDKSVFYPTTRRSRQRQDPLRVLFVGSLSVRKGIHNLLEAMAQLTSQAITLTLVGTIHDEFTSIWTRMAPPLGTRIEWRGGVSRSDLPSIYREFDVTVLPSLCDSFGQVVLESLACGTPVIATSNCGAQPRPGVDGLVVPPGNVEALATAIHQLWKDPDLLCQMSERAPAGVRTWEEFQTDFLDLAARLVGE
jgi:glycosyltransferase involved in cell wall biosynthesis